MKHIIILMVISILGISHTMAQSTKKTQFGIKGGLNHCIINGYETDGTKTGFVGTTIYGGFFAETSIGASTYLVNELNFSWVNDWHFIEVPVFIKQMLSSRFSAFLGPRLDFSANRFAKYKEDKSGLIGLALEGGVQYNITKRFFTEGRYSTSLTRQFKDQFFDINDGRRNNWRVGAGFRF
ncbi:MAG TPA: outer membrane beta-barrel protein [Chitinophagaceae bacterium]|nr:outer membrane beta-barrel protein [Chitinophagaceae bacterium]